MLAIEFVTRTGFTPSSECFDELIHPEYMSSNLDKDEWCKQWKKNGGFQRAYDWERNRYIEVYTRAARLERAFDLKCDECNEANKNLRNMKKAFKDLSE